MSGILFVLFGLFCLFVFWADADYRNRRNRDHVSYSVQLITTGDSKLELEEKESQRPILNTGQVM